MVGTIAAGVAIAKMASDMKKSDELNERAERKRTQAFRAISEAETDRMCEEEKMNKAILKLATRKNGILMTSIKRFIEVYGKIKQIRFLESDGIRELKQFSPACCDEIKSQLVIIHQQNITPASITKNMIKGFLFAGFGGMITSSIVDDAQNELDMARDKAKQARVIAEQQKIYSLSYQGISNRANHMTDILTALNILFDKSISNTEKLINEKGTERKNYSSDDIAQMGVCLNLAKAVKDILDAPILDKDSELSQETLKVIQRGNQCVIDMQNALSNI